MKKAFLQFHWIFACVLLISLTLNFMGITRYVVTSILFLAFFMVLLGIGFFNQNSQNRKKTFLIFIFVLIVLGQFTNHKIGSVNDWSRIATMGVLEHNNTFETGFNIGIDKIKVGDKYYSSKPPFLSFVGAGVYSLIRGVGHVSGRDISSPRQVYYWITFFLITVPGALAAVFFYKLLQFSKLKNIFKYLLVLSFIFGTLMFSYSGTINNHTVAALFLLIGFYFFSKIKQRKFDTKNGLLCGFILGLAVIIDLTSLVWFFLFVAYFVFKRQYKLVGLFFLGALLPLIFHLSFTYNITGGFLPPQSNPEFYNYRGSHWPDGPSGENLDAWPVYLGHIMLGHHGLFSFTPLFIFSVLGLIIQIDKRTQKFYSEGIIFSLGFFILIILFLFFNSRNYSGVNYAFRWLVPIIPLLFFFTTFIFPDEVKITKKYLFWYRVFLVLFLLVLIYSIYVAGVGALHPWRRMEPPFYVKFFTNIVFKN